MPVQNKDFCSLSTLEDKVFAGCAIHKVIDMVCLEPDCPNGPTSYAILLNWEDPKKETEAPIYRTETKTRCIL